MILVLLAGIALLAVGIAITLRATFGEPRTRVGETMDQIGRYGFGRGQREPVDTVGARGRLDDVATRLGSAVSARHGFDLNEIRRQLVAAGLYNVTPGRFLGYRVLAAIGIPLAWIWFCATLGINPALSALGTIICALVGWVAPARFVRDRISTRLQEIDDQLPELIDLLVVTVEAGVGFAGSLRLAADRLGGVLGAELKLTLQEQSMGLATNEALLNLLARADTPAMRSFVRSIVQGETLGVSIGQIMRDLAVEMRRRRRANAEERAQRAPIKILFPLVFLIFPAMFIVLLAPAVMQFLRAIKGV